MDEKEVLRGRITDLWNRTSRGDYLNHTGFLSPDLQSYAREILAKEKIPVKSEGKAGSFFFGGFEEADRQALFLAGQPAGNRPGPQQGGFNRGGAGQGRPQAGGFSRPGGDSRNL